MLTLWQNLLGEFIYWTCECSPMLFFPRATPPPTLPHELLSFEGRVFFSFTISFLQFWLVKLLHFRQVWFITHLGLKKDWKKTFLNLTGKTIIIQIDHNPKFSSVISIWILPSDFQQENSTHLRKVMFLSKGFWIAHHYPISNSQ